MYVRSRRLGESCLSFSGEKSKAPRHWPSVTAQATDLASLIALRVSSDSGPSSGGATTSTFTRNGLAGPVAAQNIAGLRGFEWVSE